ncbi:hypothetical protein HMPREF9373_0732, partial [Psychrobacter sp. 1501(2011)]
ILSISIVRLVNNETCFYSRRLLIYRSLIAVSFDFNKHWVM